MTKSVTLNPTPDSVAGTDCPVWYADLLQGMFNRAKGEPVLNPADIDAIYGAEQAQIMVHAFDRLRGAEVYTDV